MGDSKDFDNYGRIHLPDDILYLLFEYLNESDCLAFSLSGVCDRFAHLFGQQKRLSLSRCYQVIPSNFQAFSNQWLASESVTAFDASSCYWLAADFLVETVSFLVNLEELYIHDTTVTLLHLARIFKFCQKITKLSHGVIEASWQEVKHELAIDSSSSCDALILSFHRVTHLKLVVFNAAYYIDSWLIVLRILSWCQRCLDLHLEVAYTEDYFSYGPYGQEDYDEEIVKYARLNLFPCLDWMAALKSLVIVKRGSGMSTNYPDECVKELLNWIFHRYQMRSLERLWIQESEVQLVVSRSQIATPSIKSLLLGSHLRFEIDEEQFSHLHHLGGVGFTGLSHLPEIRYIRGYCIDDTGVNDFCQFHPNLEHLHLNDNNGHPFTLSNDLRLKNLKTLIYTCSYPHEGIMERLANACPNVQSLHLGYSNRSAVDPWTSVTGTDFLKNFRFDKLTILSFNAFDLFDGSFFIPVLMGCPSLRALHICGGMDGVKCFENLCSALHFARKLRDFRLHVADYERNTFDLILSLLKALVECKMLERLVFYEEEGNQLTWEGEQFKDVVVNFAIAMRHLVAFCFVSPSLLGCTACHIVAHELSKLVTPERPAFWHHIGPRLPKANDPSVPRVHYDEILCPINYYEMAPDF